jgi:hypothetical protein
MKSVIAALALVSLATVSGFAAPQADKAAGTDTTTTKSSKKSGKHSKKHNKKADTTNTTTTK